MFDLLSAAPLARDAVARTVHRTPRPAAVQHKPASSFDLTHISAGWRIAAFTLDAAMGDRKPAQHGAACGDVMTAGS
jgi:hypothetical protein